MTSWPRPMWLWRDQSERSCKGRRSHWNNMLFQLLPASATRWERLNHKQQKKRPPKTSPDKTRQVQTRLKVSQREICIETRHQQRKKIDDDDDDDDEIKVNAIKLIVLIKSGSEAYLHYCRHDVRRHIRETKRIDIRHKTIQKT